MTGPGQACTYNNPGHAAGTWHDAPSGNGGAKQGIHMCHWLRYRYQQAFRMRYAWELPDPRMATDVMISPLCRCSHREVEEW